MNKLKVRSDLTCIVCRKPIIDVRTAIVRWQSRAEGRAAIVIAHVQPCDTLELWSNYFSSANLGAVLADTERIRNYFNVMIWDKEIAIDDVRAGLVSCSGSSFTETGHGFEDLFGRIYPNEGFAFS